MSENEAQETEAPEAPETPENAPGDEAAEALPASVVVMDPTLEEESARALGEALGQPLRVVDPCCPEAAAVGDQALAFVVPWNLGTQAGLDVVQFLRRGPPATSAPIIVVSEAPTRRQVIAALQAGASSFARLPYDADELRERLGSAAAAPEAD